MFNSRTWRFLNRRSIAKIGDAMDENYNWFVIYTKSNSEQRVMRDLSELYRKLGLDYFFEPFCPESEYYYKTSKAKRLGKVYKKRPMFPSYVFIETDMPEKEFVETFSALIYRSPQIYRLLRYGSSGKFALNKIERMRFDYLFKGRRCLMHSVGIMEGDHIIITSGPLMGLEGNIEHINKREQIARVKIELYGRVLEAKLALEVVKKQ